MTKHHPINKEVPTSLIETATKELELLLIKHPHLKVYQDKINNLVKKRASLKQRFIYLVEVNKQITKDRELK
jgi:hypothetical protein